MAISALGYLGVRSNRLDDWSDFAGRLLGMQKIDGGGKALAFRMDNRVQRLLVSDEPGDTLAFMGWEVAARDELQAYAVRLERAGVPVSWGSRMLSDRRFVADLIHFEDPAGNRIELSGTRWWRQTRSCQGGQSMGSTRVRWAWDTPYCTCMTSKRCLPSIVTSWTSASRMSIGIEPGPLIGVQKGPPLDMSRGASRERARLHGAP